MKRIGFLLLPNMLSSSLTLPLEIINAAFETAISQRLLKTRCEILLLSDNLKAVKSNTGLSFQPSHRIHDINELDILFIRSLWRSTASSIQAQ